VERTDYLLRQEKTEWVVEELIALNIGLMYNQINRFYLRDDPDALSYAYEALYKAIMTYDFNKNSKFSTYATVCIYNRLGSYIRSLNTQIMQCTTSYERPVGEDGKVLLDTLESEEKADKNILSDCGVLLVSVAISECIASIKNPLHKQIVELWVRSEFQMKHDNIAEELGCTQSYVSQTIKAFKNNLKKKLEEYK
jgi:RNA polymerase sporulation-specific sigma factor